MNFTFCTVESAYCDFLREIDFRVPYTMDAKSVRPFVGIVFSVNSFHYYAPLTSPKPKHLNMKNQIDFLKIKGGEWGAINFNNMIPVPKECLHRVDVKYSITDTADRKAYKNLLANQLTWCNSHKETIMKAATTLYDTIRSDRGWDSLRKRCCDFKRCEQRMKEYCKQYEIPFPGVHSRDRER